MMLSPIKTDPSMVCRTSHFGARGLCLMLLLLAVLGNFGCRRAYYRRQADAEAYSLVREKATDPHWTLDNYTIAMDPRSRMYSPYNPDRPPMPEDDPTSHQFMRCVDGKRGYPGWDDNGHVPTTENPAWQAYLDLDGDGVLPITADDAVRLGLIHSRNYQAELEELYLSALDVSFERFRFDGQYFAGQRAFYTADGPERSGGGGNSSSQLAVGTYSTGQRGVAYQKAYTTGSTLVVGLANSLVWQFSGPNDYQGNTLLDFAFVQPLLRNAGRDRIMERLTVAERTLLGNVRAMEQYRRGFYVQVMTGRDPGAGPARRGGVLGSGFDGFTGTGGGFGRIATTGAGGAASGSGAQGAGAAAVGGYLGLLQNQQEIRNQEDNVDRLRNNLFRLEQVLVELKTRSAEPDLISNILRQDLQVAQARQALVNAESRLLNARNTYQANLDNFKFTLGLPPQMCVSVQDDLLDMFQLIDRDTMRMQVRLEELANTFGEVRLRIASHIESRAVVDPEEPSRTKVIRVLKWYDGLEQDLNALQASLEPLAEVRERMLKEFLPTTHKSLQRFAAAKERRIETIRSMQEMMRQLSDDPCPILPLPSINPDLVKVSRLDQSVADLQSSLTELQEKVQTDYAEHLELRNQRIQKLLENGKDLSPEELFAELYDGVLYPKQEAGAASRVADILVVLPSDLLALQLIQARSRAESIQLAPVTMKAHQALEVARRYNRDWMNARASVVDAWRLIEFNADNLESSLDLLFSGDVGNTTDNPLNLKASTGRLRVGVQFDAPLTRMAERNTYRQSLIEYQQARRNYYAYEDGVARSLRTQLRSTLNNQLNFELQRLAVLEAARQIDRNEDIRIEQELSNQATGATAARDSVSALTDLLDAQNNFMSIYVNYEALRRSLDLDLGTMQLDSEGLWIDPMRIDENYGTMDPWLRAEEGAMAPVVDAAQLPAGGHPGAAGVETLPPAAGKPSGPRKPFDVPRNGELPAEDGEDGAALPAPQIDPPLKSVPEETQPLQEAPSETEEATPDMPEVPAEEGSSDIQLMSTQKAPVSERINKARGTSSNRYRSYYTR